MTDEHGNAPTNSSEPPRMQEFLERLPHGGTGKIWRQDLPRRGTSKTMIPVVTAIPAFASQLLQNLTLTFNPIL
jgi:hypothetical protein